LKCHDIQALFADVVESGALLAEVSIVRAANYNMFSGTRQWSDDGKQTLEGCLVKAAEMGQSWPKRQIYKDSGLERTKHRKRNIKPVRNSSQTDSNKPYQVQETVQSIEEVKSKSRI